MPLDVVVAFKRGVYEMALTELARFVPRQDQRTRYLRGAMRGRDREPTIKTPALSGLLRGGVLQPPPGLELPPGASFDPDPQTGSHEP